MKKAAIAGLCLLAALCTAAPAVAQAPAEVQAETQEDVHAEDVQAQDVHAEDGSWPAEKCRRYAAAWSEAKERIGVADLGEDFVSRHEAFLASDCNGPHDVCPRTAAELAMADVMIIAAMNAGMASTFPPFGCR